MVDLILPNSGTLQNPSTKLTISVEELKDIFLEDLRRLDEAMKKGNIPLEAYVKERESSLIAAESYRDGGIEPWRLYLLLFGDKVVEPAYRSLAINRLHDPTKVPESAAPEIADKVIAVMQEVMERPQLGDGLELQAYDRLRLQTLMAASILRSYDPPTQMLPISEHSIDVYFLPFVERTPTPRDGQSQAEADLGYTAHTLASIARFTIVHNRGYNDLLERQLERFYKALEEVTSGLKRVGAFGAFKIERTKELERKISYAFAHPMEHLAELMEQATMTKDAGLVGILIGNGVVERFDSLNSQRQFLGLEPPNIGKYLKQKADFVALASGMGYQFR